MERPGLDLNVDSSPGDMMQAKPDEASIQCFVHACQCRNANCNLPSCQKIKRIILHTKVCKRKTKGNCAIYKQFVALCCYHAKHCQETKCSVPFCSNTKQKLKCIAAMNTRGGGGGGLPPWLGSPPAAAKPAGVPHEVQKALQQVQEEAARQQTPAYGKAAPMPPPPGAEWAATYRAPPPLHHPAAPRPSMPQRALQQLMAALQSPNSHSQQQEILQILKSNEQHIAAYIKQREEADIAQQQASGVGPASSMGPHSL